MRGKMLSTEVGLYGIRVVDRITKKELKQFGPEKIELDLNSGHFYFSLPIEDGITFDAEHKPTKIMELYVRKNPGTIKYG